MFNIGCLPLLKNVRLPVIKRISNFKFPITNKFEIKNPKSEILIVARPGFEPRQTVPKTVVLPLYYRAIFLGILIKKERKYRTIFLLTKGILKKASKPFDS
jgi:hypothetical protein